MGISFIIITNGKKEKELNLQISSIEKLNIPKYEIILSGRFNLDNFLNKSNLCFIFNEIYADTGSLGGMRNSACEISRYENLVISDDDMLFSKEWYDNFLKINQDFDIITPRVLLPDGTRFWDNCCYMSPVHGHVMLNNDEQDDFLYMSGGQSWVMKKKVWEKVKWDESLLIYKMKNLDDYKKGLHNEDTDFSLRCREHGFKIKHEPSIKVFHNDPTYTNIGRIIFRRRSVKDQKWCSEISFPSGVLNSFGKQLANYGFVAEACDLFRKAFISNGDYEAEMLLNEINNRYGGNLEESNFSFYFEEYENLIKDLCTR